MNNRDTQLAAIPIDFVVKQGLQERGQKTKDRLNWAKR